MDRKIRQFEDAGIIEHWFKLMTTKHGKSYMPGLFDKNSEKFKTETNSLELENVIGAFYLLILGYIIATLAFIVEWFVPYLRQRMH